MKKFTVILLIAVSVVAALYAQTEVTRKYEYAMVKDKGGFGIVILYGKNQKENFKNGNDLVDAFNYMDEKGYEPVSSSDFQYIFRREVKK
jgi:hypothetical protein